MWKDHGCYGYVINRAFDFRLTGTVIEKEFSQCLTKPRFKHHFQFAGRFYATPFIVNSLIRAYKVDEKSIYLLKRTHHLNRGLSWASFK